MPLLECRTIHCWQALNALAEKDDGKEARLSTITFERPALMQLHYEAGALRLEDTVGQTWVLHPAPPGDDLLPLEVAKRQVDVWVDVTAATIRARGTVDDIVCTSLLFCPLFPYLARFRATVSQWSHHLSAQLTWVRPWL